MECRNRQVERSESANQSSSNDNLVNVSDLPLRYIGVIHTHFPEKRGTPRQPGICPEMIAKLTLHNDVFTNPKHALEGLQDYSHMWYVHRFFIASSIILYHSQILNHNHLITFVQIIL